MQNAKAIITLSTIINGTKCLVAKKTFNHASSSKRIVIYTHDLKKAMTFTTGKEAYGFIDQIVNYTGRNYTVETIILKEEKSIAPAIEPAA